MVLPTNCWLSTGMIAVWSRKKKLPVIIFKASTNRQGWVSSYVTNIGPIDPLTSIVCMRIDGSKFDALIPAQLEGSLKLRDIYNQLFDITPEDVSAVNESVDSELESLLDADALAKASQGKEASDDSEEETKDGDVCDDLDDSIPPLLSDEDDTDEDDDAEIQLDDEALADATGNTDTGDADDEMVDSIVSAKSISSISVSTDNSKASAKGFNAEMNRMKVKFNPRKVKLIILKHFNYLTFH